MKEDRSRSQILFGFLPQQTVDLSGRVWKVSKWVDTRSVPIDQEVVSREVQRLAAPWGQKDSGLVQALRSGRPVRIESLTEDSHVKVEAYPRTFICRACNRLASSNDASCRCGGRAWGQLPFVAYHDCGALKEPYIPSCPTHKQCAVHLPGSAAAIEITFNCPVCHLELRKGFGFHNCGCGNGRLTHTVHRSAAVFTPRTMVLVNPPSIAQVQQLATAGGADRALTWVLGGMRERSATDLPSNRQTILDQLLASKVPQATAEMLADQAAASLPASTTPEVHLPAGVADEAKREAATLAMAVALSRTTHDDLVESASGDTARGNLYGTDYPAALIRAGVEAVDLLVRFPVLTGAFGYTRGNPEPGSSTLVPYRSNDGSYVVYGDTGETEALLVRLDPIRVAEWLRSRGHSLEPATEAATARTAILQACSVMSTIGKPSPFEDLQKVAHTYAHRLIRRASVYTGIDRTALSELLLPHHAAFIVYASPRGNFVLGGLQAVYENSLNLLMDDFVTAEHRCPLDPGCRTVGGACMACLHLGEPSCRLFNGALDRSTLFGVDGLLKHSSS